MLENKQAVANRYAIQRAKSKDIRKEALGYLLRNKQVIDASLDFKKAADKKFKESLLVDSMQSFEKVDEDKSGGKIFETEEEDEQLLLLKDLNGGLQDTSMGKQVAVRARHDSRMDVGGDEGQKKIPAQPA